MERFWSGLIELIELMNRLFAVACNRKLQERREVFQRLLKSGEFWGLSSEEKEKVSPEVAKVEWYRILLMVGTVGLFAHSSLCVSIGFISMRPYIIA